MNKFNVIEQDTLAVSELEISFLTNFSGCL